MSDQQILEGTALAAFEDAYNLIIAEEDWKVVKTNEIGDTVFSRKNKDGNNIYKIKAIIDIAPEKLATALKDIPNTAQWNKTLKKVEVLSKVSDDVNVTYNVTTEGGGGLVSARDFVLVTKRY